MNAATSYTPELRTYRRWHNGIAWLLVALLGLLWLAGYGPGGAACRPAPSLAPSSSSSNASTAQGASSSPAAPAAPAIGIAPAAKPAASAGATALDIPPAVKIFFALDKSDLPVEVDRALAAVVTYLKANPSAKAVISGFHDPSGDRAHNEALALNRARAVRGALQSVGIANDRVVLQKPAQTTGAGEAREARRVEVVVQP